MYRLFDEYLYAEEPKPLDADGRIRLDDLEMRDDVQREVAERWHRIMATDPDHVEEIAEFRSEFLRHHGFEMPGIDYDADVTGL
jgi:enoyl-[acyl-carrier protein] reductase/trans-2-enoyl-CoA reductase (NAD+)